MSRRGTLIFLCVRLCLCQLMFPSAYVFVSLCFRPLMFSSACVYARLYPCQSVSPPVCTLSTVARRALFHRSLSHLSGSVCSSRLFRSFLFSLSFNSSSSLIFALPLPIFMTLLVLPATHPFLSKSLYREQIF